MAKYNPEKYENTRSNKKITRFLVPETVGKSKAKANDAFIASNEHVKIAGQ